MHPPIAPIEAISGTRAAASPPPVLLPSVGAPDPAAVSAFRNALHTPTAQRPETFAQQPPAHRYHATSSIASSDGTHAGSDLLRWAEQTQREFSSSMQAPMAPAGTDVSTLMRDLQRVTMSCIMVSLCKNVADQIIQAGQTLLRQQN